MGVIQFAENFYAFRATERVFDNTKAAPEQASLKEIEAALVEANNRFLARQYQSSIEFYRRAERLIYVQINPSFPGVGGSGAGPVIEVPRAREIFDPMLSASAEWLNVLPLREAQATVQPRVPVASRALGDAVRADSAGLFSSELAPGTAMNAAANLSVARMQSGNWAAQRFFTDRARVLAPAVAPAMDAGPAVGAQRVLGRFTGAEVTKFQWTAGEAPPVSDIRAKVYKARTLKQTLADIDMRPWLPSDVAVNLPHDYYYVIPLGLAECYHALGDFETAEKNYLQAANYEFLNAAIEATYLWQRLSQLYLDWANSLFIQDDAPAARLVYERVVTLDDTVPESTVYTLASLKPGADIARAVIADLAGAVELAVNPLIAANVLEIRQQLLKIKGGLDFWGHWHASVPIWTFDFLQSAAINFAQMAINAERDYINFRDRSDQAAATRRELESNLEQARGEVQLMEAQAKAAKSEVQVYDAGVSLADLRAQNAKAGAEQYRNMSASQIVQQAVSAQLSGGDDGSASDLNSRADTMMGIGPSAEYMRQHPGNWKMEGSPATLAATMQLVAARMNREYEVDCLDRQATELAVASLQAEAELKAAFARQAAADTGVKVAKVRVKAAQQNLAAFDNQFFTPDVWHQMADAMLRLYQRYLTMAIRTARMMQQAFNFETDQALRIIKGSYASEEVKGLLGADALMADIQSFTYELITGQTSKAQPMKQTVSLAERYGFAFENQLRKTGIMEFETRIDDFDAYYPGTYAGRIEAIEVDVMGIVPPTGVSGTLTNAGISAYRLPRALVAPPPASGLKYRVQSKETLVLSDYTTRQDGPLVPLDQRVMRVFQGAGLASTWRLELPKAINDLDYGTLSDVRITFYYKARFDPELRQHVLDELASRPGINAGQRGLPLRWIYPDAFFRFQDTGELRITLRKQDFRSNESQPVITNVGVMIVSEPAEVAGGLKASLSTPGKPATLGTADAGGSIESDGAGSPWVPLAGGTALGEYVFKLTGADNPALVADGRLNLSAIKNVALILGYSFTPRT